MVCRDDALGSRNTLEEQVDGFSVAPHAILGDIMTLRERRGRENHNG